MKGRYSTEYFRNLVLLRVVWFSRCTDMGLHSSNNEPPIALTLTTHTFVCVCVWMLFHHNSLALFSLEKIILSQWPVSKSGKIIYSLLNQVHLSWGVETFSGHKEERRKRSIQILCTNHRTISQQIKPQASLWLPSVQRFSYAWCLGDWAGELFT